MRDDFNNLNIMLVMYASIVNKDLWKFPRLFHVGLVYSPKKITEWKIGVQLKAMKDHQTENDRVGSHFSA